MFLKHGMMDVKNMKWYDCINDSIAIPKTIQSVDMIKKPERLGIPYDGVSCQYGEERSASFVDEIYREMFIIDLLEDMLS